MRLRDLPDYVRYRGIVQNPAELVRFRSKRKDGGELKVTVHPSHPSGGHALTLRRRSDLSIFREIWVEDEYRLSPLPPRNGSDRPLGAVVDLGANVGLFAVRAAGLADRVICYEPMPENFARLSENLSGWDNVTAIQEAVAAEPGTLPLFTPKRAFSVGQFSLYRQDGLNDGTDSVDVPVTTLEAVFDRHGVDRCDLLKIDTEGAEYDILTAAPPETLARVGRVHAEYHAAPGDTDIDGLTTFLMTQRLPGRPRAQPQSPRQRPVLRHPARIGSVAAT